MNYFSTIDHFIGNNKVFEAVREASVINSGENLSNHSPIYCKLRVGDLNKGLEIQTKSSKPNWNKSTNGQQEDFINKKIKENLDKIHNTDYTIN